MTVLITGGTGLIGQDLVQYLVNDTFFGKKPQKIRLLVRDKRSNPNRHFFINWCEKKEIDIFFGDLRNDNDVFNFCNVSDPKNSVLIHCGAAFNFWQKYETLYDINVNGTNRILKAFHYYGIKKLIHISSAVVYGQFTAINGKGVDEDHPIDLNQRKGYELTKGLSELLVHDYMRKYPEKFITILRPTGIVGGSGTTTDLFARMFFGHFVPLPRGGKDKISLVDVKDVTAAIFFFSDSKIGNREVYNVVSYTTTLRDVIQELGSALGKKSIKIISIPLFLFKPMYYIACIVRFFKKANEKSLLIPILFDKLGQDVWIDNSKLKQIGLIPKATLSDSMLKTEEFITKNIWYVKEKYGFAL